MGYPLPWLLFYTCVPLRSLSPIFPVRSSALLSCVPHAMAISVSPTVPCLLRRSRLRHVFEPQRMESAPSSWWIRVCGVINLICMAFYLHWRFTRSLIGVNNIIWAYIFLGSECIMAIGMIVGHSSRSFPVHREKVGRFELRTCTCIVCIYAT